MSILWKFLALAGEKRHRAAPSLILLSNAIQFLLPPQSM
jgi:hypothetical protein